MILPTKRLNVENSLLGLGADVLGLLDQPKTVSRVWEEFKGLRDQRRASSGLTYEWFVLALDLLFIVGTVVVEDGELKKVRP
jgi:hypothetical protein